jgi:hypothetical protein
MTRVAHDLIEAAQGMDNTSDPVSLGPLACQNLQNLLADRRGILRGAATIQNLTLSTFTAGIDGVGWLPKQPVQFSAFNVSTTPLPARLVVASNGTLYSYPLVEPVTYPPTFDVASVTTQTGLIPGRRVRMAAFGQELVIVQDGNAYASYRMQYDGTLTQLGLRAPLLALTKTNNTPGGPVLKTGTVQYCHTVVDSLGRESDIGPILTVAYGSSPTQDVILHAINPYTDTQAKSVNFYATLAGGSVFYRIASVNSPTTDYEDNLPDSIVQTGVIAPRIGENAIPAPAQLVMVHKNRVFMDVTGAPGLVQISNAGSSTQFNKAFHYDANLNVDNPSNGVELQIGGGQGQAQILTGMMSYGSLGAMWTTQGLFLTYGSDNTDWQINPIHALGCIAPDSIARCNNVTCYLTDEGVYALLGNFEIEKLSKPLESTFVALRSTPTARTKMEQAVAWYLNNRYHLAIGMTIYVFDFDTKAWSIFAL